MPRTVESHRRYLFAICACRPTQPFRGKQISLHVKKNPGHDMSAKFRVCLADLDLLPASAGTKEIAAFSTKHASCPGGQVSSRKSREFFAGMQVTEYLAARQQRHASMPTVDLDSDSDE